MEFVMHPIGEIHTLLVISVTRHPTFGLNRNRPG